MHELDQQLLRATNERIAAAYDSEDFFCAEARQRLLERLSLMDMEPKVILDLGSGTGAATGLIRSVFPEVLLINLDWSTTMLQAGTADVAKISADAHVLPLTDGSVDIVVANMLLPGCADPEQVFAEARRVLRNPGLFLFNTLGPDTLIELRYAWSKVDQALHVHAFADMHTIGDRLVTAGFREPVMDVENLTVTYGDITRLVTDLRAVAATNILLERRRGLTTPRLWQSMLDVLNTTRNKQGRLNTSIEIITGQAWTGQPDAGVSMYEGEARFPLSKLRKQE
jgi:malonyl-CoA O-methyltransferase